jgi:vitamin K-dependent gamma-carboxylase
MRLAQRLSSALFRPVDAASLAVFRAVFGVVMLVEVGRYWAHGWIQSYFVEPKHFFSYPLFDFVKPFRGILLDVHFDVLAFAAACITLGLYTRVAAAVFSAGFWWWFLSDQTHYLNHFYLIALISTLLVFVPTERAFSLDARYRPRPEGATAPAWAVWLLRFQIGVPYFFGGIAKLNPDWIAGEPVRAWLRARQDLPLIGPHVTQEWCVAAFVWGGLLLDLGIVPALLWKRTRPFAYVASLLFHGTNAVVFDIGIFPWLMIAATTIYFDPDWPRRLLRRLAPLRRLIPPAPALASVPAVSPSTRRLAVACLSLWVAFQVFMPFRHFLYPGNVSWTEEGHLYAWHMKLRDKSGTGKFTGREPATGKTFEIDPRDYLTRKQAREMVEHPDMIVQFARIVASEHERETGEKLEVRGYILMSVNGRKRQRFVDPDVDLAAQRRTLGYWNWILPLTEPLPLRRAPATGAAGSSASAR